MPTLSVIGPGRAGLSMVRALARAGWRVVEVLGRGDDISAMAGRADLVVIATPDDVVAEVAVAVVPAEDTVVAHLSGCLGLDVLAPHPRRASVHPLVALPEPELGARRLAGGAWFAVAGDPMARRVVDALGGRAVEVDEDARALYHAAACVASNHLVALLGQVERVGARAGVPFAAYLDLARATLDGVAQLGPAAALTGPVARGDWATVERHLAALDAVLPAERGAYWALAEAAARLRPAREGQPGHDSGGTHRRVEVSRRLEKIDSVASFRQALDAERRAGRTVGLVPTMGFLHQGHASLMRRAAAECDVTAATIFVNPLQFAAGEDLSTYPHDLDRDFSIAASSGVTCLFVPSVEEMYPKPVRTTVSVAGVSEAMEGASRPTHFAGVATVVAKLFAIAGPCRAYFGEKDYQQLAVVRRMVSDLSFPVEVVACPTVRESDGLALSSRNVYLGPAEREAATVLYRALQSGKAAIEGGERLPAVVAATMAAVVAAEPRADLDYAEAVDARTLSVPSRLAGDVRLLVAARVGPARLIDNLGVTI